jgi:hypothetical protein
MPGSTELVKAAPLHLADHALTRTLAPVVTNGENHRDQQNQKSNSGGQNSRVHSGLMSDAAFNSSGVQSLHS